MNVTITELEEMEGTIFSATDGCASPCRTEILRGAIHTQAFRSDKLHGVTRILKGERLVLSLGYAKAKKVLGKS